jgi:hypothetical protein
VRDYLMQTRRLSRAAVDHFGLGALVVRRPDGTVRARFAAIPCRDRTGNLLTMRFRSIPGTCLECSGAGCSRCKSTGEVRKMFAHCPGRPLPLFNPGSLPADPKAGSVIVCEGELDVIALWDLGARTGVVSGTGGAGTFQPDWLDTLEPHRAFVLAYDGDQPGDDGADALADKLGRYRCSRAVLPRKDAGDCLIAGIPSAEVQACLVHAKPMVATRFASLSSYAAQIEARIARPALMVGLPTGSARLDQILGGWRPGLVVITGDTGAGKTSFTAWASKQQAMRGIPTLVTCFEQSPVMLAEKFLRQQVGGDFTKVDEPTRAAAWAALDAMPAPVHFVDHYGRMSKADLLDAIRYAVRRLDVRFAVIDHAGFVEEPDSDASNALHDLDQLVRDLALLGVNEEVCLAVIFHPNRTNVALQSRVTYKHLKGSSAIEQDAHAVVVVVANPVGKNSPNPSCTLHLDKCRSEFGKPGASCVLAYDPVATVYADTWEETPLGRAGRSGTSIAIPTGPPLTVLPTRRSAPSSAPSASAPSTTTAAPDAGYTKEPEEDATDWLPTTDDGVPV